MREQVQQLNVIMQLLQRMETEIGGMDEAATRIYIKEGFAAIKDKVAAVSAEINFNASIAVKVVTHGPSFAVVAKRELAGTYQGDFARTAGAIAAATKICIQAERGSSSSSSYSYPAPQGRGSASYNERHGGDRDFQTRPTHNQNGKRQRQPGLRQIDRLHGTPAALSGRRRTQDEYATSTTACGKRRAHWQSRPPSRMKQKEGLCEPI